MRSVLNRPQRRPKLGGGHLQRRGQRLRSSGSREIDHSLSGEQSETRFVRAIDRKVCEPHAIPLENSPRFGRSPTGALYESLRTLHTRVAGRGCS